MFIHEVSILQRSHYQVKNEYQYIYNSLKLIHKNKIIKWNKHQNQIDKIQNNTHIVGFII